MADSAVDNAEKGKGKASEAVEHTDQSMTENDSSSDEGDDVSADPVSLLGSGATTNVRVTG